jgi:hypothetical protein
MELGAAAAIIELVFWSVAFYTIYKWNRRNEVEG